MSKLRLFGYIRVSKEGGRTRDEMISQAEQKKDMESWAEREGVEIIEYFDDTNVKGGTLKRSGLYQQLRGRIFDNEADGLVCPRLDRMVRNTRDTMNEEHAFAEAEKILAFADEKLPGTHQTPEQRKQMMIMKGMMAEAVWARASEAGKKSRRHAEATKKWAGVSPRGYEKNKETGELVPNDEAHGIKKAYEMRAEGRGPSEIAHKLNELIPRKNGGRWRPQVITRMLRSTAYIGEAPNSPKDHEKIVTRALWNEANNVKAKIQPPSGTNPSKLLTGRVRCFGCRYLLSAGAKAYWCPPKAQGICTHRAVVKPSKLEEYVIDQFLQRAKDLRVVAEPTTRELDEKRARLADEREDYDELLKNKDIRKEVGPADWKAMITESLDRIDALETEIARKVPDRHVHIDKSGWEGLTDDEKRKIILRAIDIVVVEQGKASVPLHERVKILWHGEDKRERERVCNGDLPTQGKNNGKVRPFLLEGRDLERDKKLAEEMVELRERGLSHVEIADKVGVDRQVVGKRLREKGLGAGKGRCRMPEGEEKIERELVRLFEQGLTYNQIADRIGIKAQMVGRRLRGKGYGRGKGHFAERR